MMTPGAKTSAFSLATLLILAGCAVGPDFHTPPAPKTNAYTKKPLPENVTVTENGKKVVQTFRPGSDIPGEWWTLFHSRALNGLIEEALKSNPNFKAA